MITINKINESFIQLGGYTFEQGKMISNYFSFNVKGYTFMRLFKEGFWDGKIRLFSQTTGKLNIGLLHKLKKYLKNENIDYRVSKKLITVDMSKYTEEFINNYFDDVIDWDFSLRPEQVKSIYLALKYNKLVIQSPTGSGKSLILFMIIEILKNHTPESKTLLIVPTTSLVEQMRSDFIDYAKNYKDYDKLIHIIYSGKEKITDKKIIISTWQSMKNFSTHYFKTIDNLIIDEAHGINQKSKEVKKIVEGCINARFKIGDTATIDDCDLDKLMLEGLFGPIYKASSTKKLINAGILADIEIKIILLNYKEQDRKLCKRFDSYVDIKNGKTKWRAMDYFEETQFIRENEDRLKVILDIVKQVKQSENTLLLFRSLEYGKKIYDMLSSETNKKVFYVAGATDVKVREEIRKYSENNSNIIIVASMGVFSIGINIKRLHNIIIVESMKAKIKLLQSIGRSLRTHETKDKAILYDIVDNISWKNRKNYVMEHCLERIKIYDREKFDYEVKEIEL